MDHTVQNVTGVHFYPVSCTVACEARRRGNHSLSEELYFASTSPDWNKNSLLVTMAAILGVTGRSALALLACISRFSNIIAAPPVRFSFSGVSQTCTHRGLASASENKTGALVLLASPTAVAAEDYLSHQTPNKQQQRRKAAIANRFCSPPAVVGCCTNDDDGQTNK